MPHARVDEGPAHRRPGGVRRPHALSVGPGGGRPGDRGSLVVRGLPRDRHGGARRPGAPGRGRPGRRPRGRGRGGRRGRRCHRTGASSTAGRRPSWSGRRRAPPPPRARPAPRSSSRSGRRRRCRRPASRRRGRPRPTNGSPHGDASRPRPPELPPPHDRVCAAHTLRPLHLLDPVLGGLLGQPAAGLGVAGEVLARSWGRRRAPCGCRARTPPRGPRGCGWWSRSTRRPGCAAGRSRARGRAP